MTDYEKLGAFYLGRPYDLATRSGEAGGALLYDSRDLVTHGVIIGMTGSGKTGLGIGLLEEAAIDGVPAIAIDPKGDLANLLLTFPDLSAAAFRPWINEDDAARAQQDPDTFAAAQAAFWAKGLASWGQDAARIARLRAAVDISVYTPGSSAGLPIALLKSFGAPPPEIIDDHELLAERISASVTGVLTLAGVTADPVQSREHILLSTILDWSWCNGTDVTLEGLIGHVQAPPFQKVGVLPLESFFPEKDRFALAMRLNNLVASPAFAAWMQGDPLDVDTLLYDKAGKPRLSIISIAHLSDEERMFFVTMLLGATIGWMRKQSGTTSLRALLYMDEVAGYLPPSANPPSKTPMLTLLKQARAFGLGVVLSTQNPVDLDYKALSNMGTWCIGRLQTDRDKLRVLDGLEGALSGKPGFDRAELDRVLSALGKRVFLLHNVHEDGPQIFETRWTMSYLRGPLTLEQIRTLMASPKAAAAAGAPAAVRATGTGATAAAAPASNVQAPVAARPVLPPDVPQFFIPTRSRGGVHYEPRVFASATVGFDDRKLGVSVSRPVNVLVPIGSGAVVVDWSQAEDTDVPLADLEQQPADDATFADLPSPAARAKSYDAWEKEFKAWLYQEQTLEVMKDGSTGLVSTPGESEREFRIRLQTAQREERDARVEKLQAKYGPKRNQLLERRRKAEQAVAKEASQKTGSMVQAGMSILQTGIGALFGRKTFSATNVTKAASAARSIGKAMTDSQDVGRAQENITAIDQAIAALDAELQAEIGAIEATLASAPLEAVTLQPKKTQITIQRVVLAWMPS